MDALTEARMIARSQGRWGASQGSYFKCLGAAVGTGTASSLQQTFSDTSAIFLMENGAPATSNVYSYPDYFRIVVTSPDTAGTDFQVSGLVDTTIRYISGGQRQTGVGQSNVSGPVNVSLAQTAGHQQQTAVAAGALVLVAASIKRVALSRAIVKKNAAAPIGVAGDEFLFTFNASLESQGTGSKAGTTAANYRENLGIVCIPPQGSFALNAWFTAALTAGFTFEWEAGWWELASFPA
jgi:hypothetical protein